MKKLLCLLVAACLMPILAQAEPIQAESIRFDGAEAVAELASSGRLTYKANNAIDGKLDTCWAYAQGEAPGATISFYVDEPVSMSGLSLTPGYAKSDALFLANNRVKKIRITLSDESEFEADFEDGSDRNAWVTVEFEEPHVVEWVRLQVLEVYPGETYDDTCISEVKFF